jgi:hypothetical protein
VQGKNKGQGDEIASKEMVEKIKEVLESEKQV